MAHLLYYKYEKFPTKPQKDQLYKASAFFRFPRTTLL